MFGFGYDHHVYHQTTPRDASFQPLRTSQVCASTPGSSFRSLTASRIMRVGNLISAFALISFLSICFPSAAVYIQPWLHVFEGFALGSFFLLLCDYVSPHRDQRDVFFATKRKNGMKWFKVRLSRTRLNEGY
jgi:hypothetical protein